MYNIFAAVLAMIWIEGLGGTGGQARHSAAFGRLLTNPPLLGNQALSANHKYTGTEAVDTCWRHRQAGTLRRSPCRADFSTVGLVELEESRAGRQRHC
jgi:hypothetical protein